MSVEVCTGDGNDAELILCGSCESGSSVVDNKIGSSFFSVDHNAGKQNRRAVCKPVPKPGPKPMSKKVDTLSGAQGDQKRQRARDVR